MTLERSDAERLAYAAARAESGTEGKQSRGDIADPDAMPGIRGKPELCAISAEARERLQRVLAALNADTGG